MTDLTNKILAAVKKAHKNEAYVESIFSQDIPAGKNEFLMFIKPEILFDNANLKSQEMIDLVLKKIEQFKLKIHDVKLLSAKYLEEHNIIAQHYGVINKIANNAVKEVSQAGKEKFKEIYGKDMSECKVLGGFEFLKAYPQFTPFTLDIVWQQKVSKKLAGGTYAVDAKVDDETVYIINGFHPRQIDHFTQKGRSIVVLVVSGDTSWTEARENLIGNTFPEKANEGSIRREFLNKKDYFGMPDVSIANNGIHLSAGPVEGLIELVRYSSDFSDKSKIKSHTDFSFGKKLLESFNKDQFDKIVANQNVNVEGKSTSIFDLTEQKDSDESIALIKKHLNG